MARPIAGAESLRIVLDRSGPESGPTVLLLHAGGETRRVWHPIVDALQPLGWQIVAPDLRGHGDSERAIDYRLSDFVDDIEIMIDQACDSPLLVVGSSIGGLIGLIVAGQAQSKVDGLILVDVTPQTSVAAGEQERAKVASAVARGAPRVSSVDPKLALGSLVPEILDTAQSRRVVARQIESPVLLMRALGSHAVGEKELRMFLEDVPHAAVKEVDGGHLIARDQPQLVAETIREFVTVHALAR